MADSRPCGNCKACKEFNGKDGNGYQPCHRPIPPYVEPPRIEYIGGDDIMDGSFDLYPWVMFLWGFFAGLIFSKFIF